jgi:hypothetical protein
MERWDMFRCASAAWLALGPLVDSYPDLSLCPSLMLGELLGLAQAGDPLQSNPHLIASPRRSSCRTARGGVGDERLAVDVSALVLASDAPVQVAYNAFHSPGWQAGEFDGRASP